MKVRHHLGAGFVHTVQAPVTDVTIDAVLAGRLVRPLFQPIVDLSTRTAVGVEALARGPAGTVLEFPDRLFAAGRAAGRLGELDMLCFEQALEGALAAPVAPPLLFANGEPAVMDQPLSPRLLELFAQRPTFRTILEYTERALPSVPGSLLRLAGMIERDGNAIALDDVGVDPMSLAMLPVLEPEVIKLDMSLVRNPGAEHTRTVSAVVRAEAQRTGAVVIAEGIETEADLHAAHGLGAHWGQGWLFGRPAGLEQAGPFDEAARDALRGPRPGFHQPAGTPFEIAARHRPAVSGTVGDLTAGLDRLRDVASAHETAVVVASFAGSALPAGALHDLAGLANSAILLDEPIPGEGAAVVVGPGYGYALCARTAGAIEVVAVDDHRTAATVARALLNRTR
jgi:EAL domain-containing protein (putative c-di-GMP-specific phosphodiesterase class I)